MDGFAVAAENTFGAGPENPISLKIGRDAWPVNTGRPLPPAANAVIMIENVNFLDDENFEIEQAVVPWQNARRVGEDFVASEMILPARHIVTSYEIGALLAGGVRSIEVMRKPKVAIIPTGSELVAPDVLADKGPGLGPGEVVEYNSSIFGRSGGRCRGHCSSAAHCS